MRIAVLGDIHSNLAALEAVLAELSTAGCDLVLHTGGLVGYGARPNETLDLVRARHIEGVRGHFDEDVAWSDTAPWQGNGAPAAKNSDGAGSDGPVIWNARRIGFTQRQFLKDLPFSIEKRIGERTLTLFHASPIDITQAIEESASESWLEELAEETGADVHLFGHTHRPFHREVNGRHFINAGSVGRPQDGDPRACIAFVEVGRGIGVEFRRIAYDVETTAREIEAVGLAPNVAQALRTGT